MRWFILIVMSLIIVGVTLSMIFCELEGAIAFWLGVAQSICFIITYWIISEEK